MDGDLNFFVEILNPETDTVESRFAHYPHLIFVDVTRINLAADLGFGGEIFEMAFDRANDSVQLIRIKKRRSSPSEMELNDRTIDIDMCTQDLQFSGDIVNIALFFVLL
jgi:hypothetical protein